MKKMVGFAMLMALIVAPLGVVAEAQQSGQTADNWYNLFPIAFGTFAEQDTYLAVTNIFGPNYQSKPTTGVANPIVINSVGQDGSIVRGESNLKMGETRIYASNPSVHTRNFGCANTICTVTVCAPDDTLFGDFGPENIISALFWLNNGQFYAITTPFARFHSGNGTCPLFGSSTQTPPPPVHIP